MRVPPPLSQFFTGRGKFLSTGVTVLVSVLTAYAFGVEGLVVLFAGIAVLLVVELWIDSGRMQTAIESGQEESERVRVELGAANSELAEARARAEIVPDLRRELEQRTAEIDALKQELANPQLTLEQLLGAPNAAYAYRRSGYETPTACWTQFRRVAGITGDT